MCRPHVLPEHTCPTSSGWGAKSELTGGPFRRPRPDTGDFINAIDPKRSSNDRQRQPRAFATRFQAPERSNIAATVVANLARCWFLLVLPLPGREEAGKR